jgi:DNA-binding ferritin-like protein (Dps family)
MKKIRSKKSLKRIIKQFQRRKNKLLNNYNNKYLNIKV